MPSLKRCSDTGRSRTSVDHPRRGVAVVGREVGLRDPVVGEEDLVGMGERDVAATGAHYGNDARACRRDRVGGNHDGRRRGDADPAGSRRPAASDAFLGRAATPRPLSCRPPRRATRTWRPTGSSNIHDDAYQTDTYRAPARWAPAASRRSRPSTRPSARSITFDARGRLVTVCVGLDRPDAARCSTRTRSRRSPAIDAAAAPARRRRNPLQRLRRRRLLLPRRPRPRGDPHDRRATSASSARPRRPRFALDARLRR